jgi:hypothetical protein
MTELAKAMLTELNASNRTVGQPVAVQFNPASLRMQLSNRSSGGAQAGSPARQRAGEGSLSLSFDLQFDSADEGTAEAPVSVLRKTAPVERFVRPRGNAPGEEAPPRVQFEWGGVKVQGVMESLSLDLDLFAFDGTPLRARCAVQIKGQDPSYACAPQGAGAGGGAGQAAVNAALQSLANVQGLMQGAALADALGQGLTGAAKTLDSVTRALSGESLPQLAQRAGLDPKAWRELAPGAGANPQSLPAGREVAVPKAGAPAKAPQSGALGPAIGAALGQMLSSSRRLAPAEAAQLTRAGGVGAAQAQLRRESHQGGAKQALAGFGQATAVAPATQRAPISVPEDRPFGFGLPLKPRRAVAAAAQAGAQSSRRRCACAPLRCACGCGGA